MYRVKASLNPATMDWSAIRALPPRPAESQDREPAALVKANGDVELFWSANRNGSWSIWRAAINRATQVWGPAEMVITSPTRSVIPCPFSCHRYDAGLSHERQREVFSTVYGTTTTVDQRCWFHDAVTQHRQACSMGNLRDFPNLTSDVGQNGERTNVDQYARETVGLYLAADTTDQDRLISATRICCAMLWEFYRPRCGPYAGSSQREERLMSGDEREGGMVILRATPLIQ